MNGHRTAAGIAYLLIVILALAGLACATKQPPAAGTAAPDGDVCVLQHQNALHALATPGQFNAENLWEYLNGGAAQILELGFMRLCVFELADEQNRNVAAFEIFRMADSNAAQRLFNFWKAEEGEKLNTPREAWRSGTTISFAHNSFYVRVYLTSDQPDATKLLRQAFELAAANVD